MAIILPSLRWAPLMNLQAIMPNSFPDGIMPGRMQIRAAFIQMAPGGGHHRLEGRVLPSLRITWLPAARHADRRAGLDQIMKKPSMEYAAVLRFPALVMR